MKKQFNGKTFEMTFVNNVWIATWRGYSAEGWSQDIACYNCNSMILEDEAE